MCNPINCPRHAAVKYENVEVSTKMFGKIYKKISQKNNSMKKMFRTYVVSVPVPESNVALLVDQNLLDLAHDVLCTVK